MFGAPWPDLSAPAMLGGLLVLTLKTGLLMALAAIAACGLRRAAARSRRALWVAALAGSLALPAVTPLVPSWRVPWLPELAAPLFSKSEAAGPAQLAGASEIGRPFASAVAAPRGEGHRADPTAERGLVTATPVPDAENDKVGSDAIRSESRAGSHAAPSRATPFREDGQPVPWTALAFALWLTGATAVAGRLLFGLVRAYRISRRATPPERRWTESVERHRRRLGVVREVQIAASPEVASPMTWGFLRPRVLLPATATSWSPERLEVVLLHELVHIRRADWLARMVARTACAIHWFNPLVWFAERRLAAEQELACDDEVVRLGTRPSTYARHLLAIARSIRPRIAPLPALEMAPRDPKSRSQMEARLMSILSSDKPRKTARSIALPLLLVVVGLVPALAAVQPIPGADTGDPATGAPAVLPGPAPASDKLRQTVREIGELEDQLEPFEAELEALEEELEPVERQLEALEEEMEPVEGEFDGIDAELEPFERRLEELEAELEPFEERLEAIATEFEPNEGDLEAIETELEPFEGRLAAIGEELEPFQAELATLEEELDPLEDELDELEERLDAEGGSSPDAEESEELRRKMSAVRDRMAPVLERMAEVRERMRPVLEQMTEVHREMRPIHRRMEEVHERMKPARERMAAIHEQMRPVFERMSEIHQKMQPVHLRMEERHERMRPVFERMESFHEQMRPVHQKMEGVHERMRLIHEEIHRRHEKLHAELVGVVEGLLVEELAAVVAADAPFGAAAAAAVEETRIQVDDGRLRLRGSAPRLGGILREKLTSHQVGSPQAFDEAIEAAARRIVEVEIDAG